MKFVKYFILKYLNMNNAQENSNYCELSGNIYTGKYSYKGNKPFIDPLKSGLAISFSIMITAVGLCWIYRIFNKDKSNSCKSKADDDKQTNYDIQQQKGTYLKAETLYKICSEPYENEDIKSSQLCGKILCKGDCLTLYSNAKEGKSTLAMGMCIDIANGTKPTLLNEADIANTPRPTRVIYYDSESSKRDLQNRYKRNEQESSNIPNYPDNLFIVRGTFASVGELFDDIDHRVMEQNSDVVVCIDNLANIIPNDSKTHIDRMFSRQKAIKSEAEAKGYNATFIIVTHTQKTAPGKKNENIKGSSQILNLSTTVVELLPTDFGREYKQLKIQACRNFPLSGNSIFVRRVKVPYPHFEYCEVKDIKDRQTAQNTNVHSQETCNKLKCPKSLKSDTNKQPVKQYESLQDKPSHSTKHQPNLRVTKDVQNEMIKLYNQGKGPSAIGQKLGFSRKTITRWINKLKEEGRISA